MHGCQCSYVELIYKTGVAAKRVLLKNHGVVQLISLALHLEQQLEAFSTSYYEKSDKPT
jgi:hypothetical protein